MQSKYDKAYEMRHNPTRAEELMWDILKNQVVPKFPQHIFRRQWVAYGYILDFYCPTLKIGIEVDGGVHNDSQDYDRWRDSNLGRHGIRIYRVRNEAVYYHSQEVANEFCEIIRKIVTMPWYKRLLYF